MNTSKNQNKVEHNFSRQAHSYDQYSSIQKKIAAILIQHITAHTSPKTILEIGCGTGSLTKLLRQKYPHAIITATDISDKMIKTAQTNWTDSNHNLEWKTLDGENINSKNQYDLIISNMSVQWLNNISQSYTNWLQALKAGGEIITSRPAKTAFHEWKSSLESVGLSSGIIEPQETSSIATIHIEPIKCTYPATIEFLRSIKKTGAHTAKNNYKQLSPKQIKLACEHCDKTYNSEISWDTQIDKIIKNS